MKTLDTFLPVSYVMGHTPPIRPEIKTISKRCLHGRGNCDPYNARWYKVSRIFKGLRISRWRCGTRKFSLLFQYFYHGSLHGEVWTERYRGHTSRPPLVKSQRATTKNSKLLCFSPVTVKCKQRKKSHLHWKIDLQCYVAEIRQRFSDFFWST